MDWTYAVSRGTDPHLLAAHTVNTVLTVVVKLGNGAV